MPTKIEWCDETWNPVSGCDHVSPGCDHCYAETLANRFAGTAAYPDGFAVTFRPHKIDQPLRWARPRRVFVNSMSDLFHTDVLQTDVRAEGSHAPYLATIFAVMAAASQHTFQVLTKRPQLMSAVLREPRFRLDVNAELLRLGYPVMPGGMTDPDFVWPANIWLGVSVENQRYADMRIRHLVDTPAAVRFLSCEPLLGPVSLQKWLIPGCPECKRPLVDATRDWQCHYCSRLWPRSFWPPKVDWVIVGGESGHDARPMHPDWARTLRDECVDAGVPFLFKQWGEYLPLIGHREHLDLPEADRPWGRVPLVPDGSDSLDDGAATIVRVGKKAAGRVLDGITWDGYPEGNAR